ncbi:hypothetical protein FRB99_005378 [Tulasnella sp. 403]|nr:hypothetical protein FRB99_005378 [Tulasnella sp. 403]
MTEDHQRGEGDDVSIAGGELLKKERGFSGSSFNGDASRASIPARPGAYGRLDAQIQILLEVNRNTAAAVKSLNIERLQEAIAFAEESADACSEFSVIRSDVLDNLGWARRVMYEETAQEEYLGKAVEAFEEAVNICPPDFPGRSRIVSNFACVLKIRFEANANVEDLDRGIALEEVTLAVSDAAERSRRSGNLASSLRRRFGVSANFADFERSIALTEESVNDYSVLKVDDVICQLRNAVNSPHCPSDSRLVISLSWVKASIEFHRESLFDAYTAMYDALDVVITRGHSLASRYNQLTTRQDIAKAKAHFTDAVHFAVTNNRPRDAVIFLERGRSLLLAQVGHCRMPLDYVKEKDADLAAQLESVGRQLDRLLGCDTKSADSTSRSVANDATIQFMRLTARWNALVEDARRLDGCSDFLKPSRFESLQQGASGGPVVFINVTESSSHAVVVVSVGDPLIIPLPDATPTQIDKLTSVLLDTRDKQARTFTLALRDLWDIIIGPVVDHVKPLVPIRSRIWWCPSASVAELPLHAAGHYYKGADSDKRLPHLFVSSYTSSLGALIRARRATPQHLSSAPNLLVISQPDTKGEIELNVRDEITSISRKLSDTTVLEGPDGTPDAIATAIPNHSWVHFSCHAYAVSDNPLRSHFILHEGHLQVLDILRIQNPDAELAVLTACHTAGAGTSAPEEFLHLAGAMQFTGFRSVIGTLWKMDDGDGSFVVKELYRQLFEALDKGNRLAYTCAAEALQDTVWKLRTERKAEPWRWANYVHYGA